MWECAWGSTQNHSTGRFWWFYLPRSTAQCAAWSRTWSPYITVRSGGKCGAGWWLGSARSFNGVHPLQWNLRQVTINEWIILCQNTITTTTIDSQSMQCFANAWQKCWQGMFCMFVRPCSRFLQFVLVCYIYIYWFIYLHVYCIWNLHKFTDWPLFRIMICTFIESREAVILPFTMSRAGGARRIGQRSHDRFSQEGGLRCERACQHMAFARRCSFSFKMLACIIWYQVSFVKCF